MSQFRNENKFSVECLNCVPLTAEMSDEKIKSCRICLKLIQDGIIHRIGKNTKDTLDLLLVKLDLSVTEEPLMCTNCAEILEKCHSFKVRCLQTENKLEPYVNNGSKINIRQVYLNENGNEDLTEVVQDPKICRLCLKTFSSAGFVSLVETDEDTTLVKNIIQKYIPELDLTKTEDPTVCGPCHKCLQCYYILVNNCLDVENKMKQFSTVRGRGEQFTKEELDIGNVVNPLVKHEECSMLIKMEPNDADAQCPDFVEDAPDFVDMPNLFLKNEEIKIEPEKSDDESSDWCQPQIGEQANSSKGNRKSQSAKGRKCSGNSTLNSFKCKLCTYETSQRSNLNCHSLVHKSLSEVKSYKCNVCTYKTKYRQCLKSHLLLHKNPSELTMYKCKICTYETKYNHYITKHMKRHKISSEVTMIQCELCQFKTKSKNYFKTHMKNHKNPDELTMHQCEVCGFKSKHKEYLKKHMLMHKSRSEIVMFKCNECSFQTKYKSCLRRHVLTHRSLTDVVSYKCEVCTYQTRYKYNIKKHMLLHKSDNQAADYKCEICSHETKDSHAFNRHMLSHRDPSSHVCKLCSYKTEKEELLDKHMLSHSKSVDPTLHKCDSCPFETKYKQHLTRHMVSHKNPSELNIIMKYKCEKCPYQTDTRKYLWKHALRHKSDSEVTIYTCEMCEYKTRYKQHLTRHSCRIRKFKKL